MSGEAGEELGYTGPRSRIMARRESRAAMPDHRLKVAAPDDSSDEEWNGDDDEDEEEAGRVYLDASKCGRVRLHAVQGPAQSSSGLGVDDERRKSLADKGWAVVKGSRPLFVSALCREESGVRREGEYVGGEPPVVARALEQNGAAFAATGATARKGVPRKGEGQNQLPAQAASVRVGRGWPCNLDRR